MKKKILLVLIILSVCIVEVSAQTTYTVKSGDSIWKIAVKYETGVSEILAKNPQVKNPSLIYPGQKLTIPDQSSVKALEAEVIRLVNVERAKKGLQALKADWEISRVARYKSQDMINKKYFSHTSPTYGSPFKMLETFGIRFSSAGENIAYGQKTPAAVMNSWMNSSGHRANILSPSYTHIGVGLAKTSSGVCYWTQMFTKPLK
ncbi:SafA/ExsA family spore coat assembly protein [Ruminiclostridium herbifermentans]|uniref:SafA/ExsA family spore coat assembly protein n=1 Tax=Ruminiclostridium herbifermentans TaxID=2488810 RepID=A0A4V6ENI7_9FIRM|nr:SafA/ExsA family spore coat assembly protein [Ruminiclostridium herbifermentans]QNU67741.1 SafA/ExsA family spore coat assembly protein [Ruminiclostridium herbifermentans]